MVGVGMIRNQTAWVQQVIDDPEKTGLVVVSLAEEMPAQETSELLDQLPKEVNTPVLAIVANRVMPPPPDANALRNTKDGIAIEAALLCADIAQDQGPDLDRLKNLGPPTAIVPLMGFEHHGLPETRRVAAALEEASG